MTLPEKIDNLFDRKAMLYVLKQLTTELMAIYRKDSLQIEGIDYTFDACWDAAKELIHEEIHELEIEHLEDIKGDFFSCEELNDGNS